MLLLVKQQIRKMKRRDFLRQGSLSATAAMVLPSFVMANVKERSYGVQLYTFREAMATDPMGTLKQIAALGIKEIESARSSKGHYYGLSPQDMKKACEDLDMTLISGHVALDNQFERTMEEAITAGQPYLICSSLPSKGQTKDNYKRVAEAFNKAGEACQKAGLKFGYHNHEYEFESHQGEILYDVLMDQTDPELVHMELDLGWVLVAGLDPLHYFEKYPGRFPLWHLKDMNIKKKESTEFGKGGLDIKSMLNHIQTSGAKHIFIEQEEYAYTPLNSMKFNMEYLKNM
jgi:sugar phosphate isomerase/epimerase